MSMLRGISRYIAALSALRAKPATVKHLAARLDSAQCSVYSLISHLHRAGLVHIGGWENKPRTASVPVYAFGPGDDEPYPEKRMDGRKRTCARRKNASVSAELSSFIAAWNALKESSLTRAEVGEASGYHKNATQRLIRELHAKKLVFISEWRQDAMSRPVAAFTFGLGKKDAPKPKATASELNRRYRERMAQIHMIQRLAGPANVATFEDAA